MKDSLHLKVPVISDILNITPQNFQELSDYSELKYQISISYRILTLQLMTKIDSNINSRIETDK